MGTTSVLSKLGDAATSYGKKLKSLPPDEVERQSVNDKSDQVDAYNNAFKGEVHSSATPDNTTYEQDKINPKRSLEDRGLKKIDTKEMLKPLGEGQSSIPVYDTGGDVDVNDGKHQLAVLEDGEKVLNPDEAAQYKAKQSLENHPVEEAENRPLKPIGEDVKAARQKVENPGAQTVQPVQTPEQLPTASHEERVAIKKDQQDAMGMGVNGLVKLGMANIHAKQLGLPGVAFKEEGTTVPKEFQRPEPAVVEGQGLQVPKELQRSEEKPAGLPTIGGTDAAAPAQVAPPLGYKEQLEKLKQEHAAALAERTPEGKVKADYIQEQINNLHKDNPWGSKENHPGILGKLGHVAAKVGNIAGDVLAPGLMMAIPGTEMNRNFTEALQNKQTQEDQGLATDQEKAEALKAKNAARPNKVWKEMSKPVMNPATGKYEVALYNESDPEEIRFKGEQMPPVQKPSGAADKHVFQQTLAKTQDPNAAEPTKQIAALKKAKDNGVITDQEYFDALGFLGTNASAPATSVSTAGTKAEQNADVKDAHKFYTWTEQGPNGPVVRYGKGSAVPKDAEASEQDSKTFMNEARASNVVQQSLNQIYEDVEKHPEVFDNASARAILATTLDQIDRTSAGLLIAGTGGSIPLPSGLGDMINTHLQNHTLDPKTAEAVRNYIADYKSMKDKVIAMQMEMQGGKIGRGSHEAFKAIADQIPNGGTPDSKTAVRQMNNLQRTQAELSSKYPDQFQGYKKEKPYQPKTQAEGQEVKQVAEVHDKQGKLIGHIVQGEDGKKKYQKLEQ